MVSNHPTLMRMMAIGAPAVLVAAAIAVALLWSTGAMGRGDTVTPPGVLEFPADGELEGGRTYRFPDGSWLIEVPEGMRLWYSSISESPAGTRHGFTDPETGSLISIQARSGEVLRYAAGDDEAAANARLDRFEAGFRRPPDYVEPTQAIVRHEPRQSADGYLILDEEGVFEGGRTYVIPGNRPLLLKAPAGIRFTFSESVRDAHGGRYYGFWAADRSWFFSTDIKTGHLNMFYHGDNSEARRLADAVTAAFED